MKSELEAIKLGERTLSGELFSIDLLRRHSRELASSHKAVTYSGRNKLLSRLAENEKVLTDFNNASAGVGANRSITPAAEWLLDNAYLIEDQIQLIRRHLPERFNKELPHITEGTLGKIPRVYDLAEDMLSHVDGRIDEAHLTAFISGYQEGAALQLGELWAVPIMLRLALIERLRSVAVALTSDRKERISAGLWADQLLDIVEKQPSQLIILVADMAKSGLCLSRAFVAEFWRRMQEKAPAVQIALNWIEECLAGQNTTIEQLVHSENQSQAANQVSVGNCIGSLRFISATDWKEFVEGQSVVEQTLQDDPSGVYARLDFATRDSYRHAVEKVGRHTQLTEREVAAVAVELARVNATDRDGRKFHVGYYLVGKGISELEAKCAVRVPIHEVLPRLARRNAQPSYFAAVSIVTLLTSWPMIQLGCDPTKPLWLRCTAGVLSVIGGLHLATTLLNWFSTFVVPPRSLPRLDFSDGVPPECRTIVTVPTMLTNIEAVDKLIDGIEIRYLANKDPNVFFALLTDFADAREKVTPADSVLLMKARSGIEMLNQKYSHDRLCIFYWFHRPRMWNEKEAAWMGYERKRGKLADFNRCLRGHGYEAFTELIGDFDQLQKVKYVITLDTDTQLPRDAVWLLVASMAHPLNKPVYDPGKERVVEGYSILQPRVAISLSSSRRSRFAQIFSGDPGIDPYTRAVSDVYQDLFGEGSFIGKGIYDVDAFEKSVANRFPENRILSHDLIEGCYARSGLITDVQLFEEFPERFSSDAKRRHRWTRGDWQIATWLLPRTPGPGVRRITNPISFLSKWKILDNLRRSLTPPALVLLLVLGWSCFYDASGLWTAFVGLCLLMPGLLAVFSDFMSDRGEIPIGLFLRNVLQNASRQLMQAFLGLAFLAFDACLSLDAIVRTLVRIFFTRRHLLEWQTSSETERTAASGLRSYWQTMWCSTGLAVLAGLLIIMVNPYAWRFALPFLVAWSAAPVLAWWISLPFEPEVAGLSERQTMFLQRVSRKTWRYFETFVTDGNNWLPPDNFQEIPSPVLAERTSPTNMGMALLSTLAAWDFGYISTQKLAARLEATLAVMAKLERYRGHFYNWYDTRTLQPLAPLYVSTVDNGNLSGMLLTLRAGLIELIHKAQTAPQAVQGLRDTLQVLLATVWSASPTGLSNVKEAIQSIDDRLHMSPKSLAARVGLFQEVQQLAGEIPQTDEAPLDSDSRWWLAAFQSQCKDHINDYLQRLPWLTFASQIGGLDADVRRPVAKEWWRRIDEQFFTKDVSDWIADLDSVFGPEFAARDPASARLFREEFRDALMSSDAELKRRSTRFSDLARECETLANMDFTLLYDPFRQLFSIGYNVAQHKLDVGCYDLLASEARVTSFVAVSLGQVSQDHWFNLGRLLTSVQGRSTLISWSGSMFEYLMPLLFMPTFEFTLLDVSCRNAIERQMRYGRELGIPWGVSESGYNYTDAHSNYQYHAFGVPGLGFKRGLAQDRVVAPYAGIMALMMVPSDSVANMERLVAVGAEGPYGFYEAVDFTPTRLQPGRTHEVVRSYMVHHQGMAFLALAHHLLGQPMQRRFNANALFRATELLLQERVPKQVSVLFPHASEVEHPHQVAPSETAFRVFTNPNGPAPDVHLLSNGRYHVMISTAGSGYSLWGDLSVTRWREDTTRDSWGSFIYLRDIDANSLWSVTYQPTLMPDPSYEAIFSQARAEFRTRLHELEVHTEIAVSPEDDVEVRRVSLINRLESERFIELTTYCEVALNTLSADQAHPAFNKLFIQTEILKDKHAILVSRRPRARSEKPPWLFHLLIVREQNESECSYETDRAKFIGRGRNSLLPLAFEGNTELSNTDGYVLDPVLAIRRTVRVSSQQSSKIIAITGYAATRDAALALVEKYQDSSLADRVFDLSWTHGLVTLRHLNVTESHVDLYDTLAGALLFNQPTWRANSAVLAQNSRGQRHLWPFGISGDVPIILLRATSSENLDLVREVIQAHAYLRIKGLVSELVILNEDTSTYRQSIHDQIVTMIGSSLESHLLDKPGGVFVRRLDQIAAEDRILLQAAARVVLSDVKGSLARQLRRGSRPRQLPPPIYPIRISDYPSAVNLQKEQDDLVFANGLGGFSKDGTEYVINLAPNQNTPAPWANVVANPEFGTLISERGCCYTWSQNCHEFRLTPWENDPVSDTGGEGFYIRDEKSGEFWSPTPWPARISSAFKIRHGFGYSSFLHTHRGIATEFTISVAAEDPVKLIRLVLRNVSQSTRSVSIFGYVEWVLGEFRQRTGMHLATEFDLQRGAILARNPFGTDFQGRVAFFSATDAVVSATADRGEFLGRNNTPGCPSALGRAALGGRFGHALDACAALQVSVELAPQETHECFFQLGVAGDLAEAQALIDKYRVVSRCVDALAATKERWVKLLNAVQVETPDQGLDFLANGWLVYQTLSCRMWARTGYYQSGGAYGFRDQLQDSMALVHTAPEILRAHLLRAASHQFSEGDVQHWWHPPSNRGVRTHFSDDFLWLPLAVCRYVDTSADLSVLDEVVPFIQSRLLRPEEESNYDSPQTSSESVSLYGHCVRAIQNGLRLGRNGLPLMGCGDWNDGMNLVGQHGEGESVWLAFFQIEVFQRFAGLATRRGDVVFAQICQERAVLLKENLEKNAWDGQWYRRAFFDSGEPLGSASNPECQIDSIPQSWAVISGAGEPKRIRSAMEAVSYRLVRHDSNIVQLFDPPFDKSDLEPGYIKGYVPGVRENGGQYTHAAIWAAMAFAEMGDTQRAWNVFQMINPINHSRTAEGLAKYKVEPYVMAADVYGAGAHSGRGGWTWYTGSSGWMYRLVLESLLGLVREGGRLRFNPKVPSHWRSFKVHYCEGQTTYHISLLNLCGSWVAQQDLALNGRQLPDHWLPLGDDGRDAQVEVRFVAPAEALAGSLRSDHASHA